MLKDIYLAGGVRTAIGGFLGAFTDVSACALGATVIKGALAKANASADSIDEVILGNVVGAGQGQNLAR